MLNKKIARSVGNRGCKECNAINGSNLHKRLSFGLPS